MNGTTRNLPTSGAMPSDPGSPDAQPADPSPGLPADVPAHPGRSTAGDDVYTDGQANGLAYVTASDVPPAPCPPAKAAAVRRVVDEWVRRRDAGGLVPERVLAAEHPELMPELARALSAACDGRKALLEARKAGAPSRALTPLAD